MILLNTKFNVDSAFDRRSFFELILAWIRTSDRYNLPLDTYDWQDDDWQIQSDDGSQKAIVNNYEKMFIFQFIVTDGEESATYTTTYVLDDISDVHSMHFTHERTFAQASFLPSVQPKIHLPNAYKSIFWNEYGGDDNGLLVDYKPHVFRRIDVELAKQIVQQSIKFQNPVVYVSPTSQGNYNISCDYVAQELMGQAHVVVEGSPVIASAINKATDGANPFNGGIRVYAPGGDPITILNKGKGTSDEVISAVRNILSNVAVDDSFDAVKLRQMHMFTKFGSDDEFSKLCEDMLRDKDSEIAQLKAELSDAKQQLMCVRAKADNLQNSFEKSDSSDNAVPIEVTEKDLYEGEIKDVILRVLQKEFDSIKDDPNTSNSRKYDVLKDILDQNFPCTTGTALIECFRSAFNDGVLTREGIGHLRSSGFSVEKDGRSAHYKITLGGDERYSCTFSSTPSDKTRGLKNSISEFANVLFGY